MATTTNYGWTTPDDTALVKDGAAAIRTLGSSVDTTTKNLNPSTTAGDIEYRSSTTNVNTRLALGTAGQVLSVNSGATAPEWKTFSSGKVLQVVSTTYNTSTNVASTSFTDTGLSLSITPTASNSKVLVLASQVFYAGRSTGQAGHSLRLVRGATTVYTLGADGLEAGYVATSASNPRLGGFCPVMYLDDPATTSSTTYKIQGRAYDATSSGDVTYQGFTSVSTITLLEIGA
jgi:hypothetical protein